MEKELLEKMKLELAQTNERQRVYNSKKRRIEELEQNEYVREYFNLLGELRELENEKILQKTEEEMIISMISRYIRKIKQTNGIYIYLGTFRNPLECDILHGNSPIRVNRCDSKADYRLYQDIEREDAIQIAIKECEVFEKEHIVIFPNTYLLEKYYYELQMEFFSEAIHTNQENAVKKIMKQLKK